MEWIAQRMMFYSKINCKCFKIFFYFQSSSLSRFHLGSSTSELGFGLHILPTFIPISNSLGEEAALINVSISKGGLKCQRVGQCIPWTKSLGPLDLGLVQVTFSWTKLGIFLGSVPVAPGNNYGWGYTHDGRADKYPYPHDRRADKDSYPHDSNVTDDLCSLIKLCFAFIMVLWLIFWLNVFYCYSCWKLFTLNSAWIIKKMHNRRRPKPEKHVIDHSTGDKN